MRALIVVIILFLSVPFYGQEDVKVPVIANEPVVKVYEDYQKRLDSLRSKFEYNDKIYDENSSIISVASADKMKVVYRGLPNPISISVPNAKLFEASAPGLTKLSEGKYTLRPGSGLETMIIIYIILNDGSKRKEVHKFRIKNIPYLTGAINGLTCNQSIILMSKKELRNAVLSIGFSNDFSYDLEFKLESFRVKIGKENIYIAGTKLNSEALSLIDKLPLKSVFEIVDFKSDIDCPNCSIKAILPLKIMIVEDED